MAKTDRHIRGAFDHELHGLEDDVLRMGGVVGDLIHRAVQALLKQDTAAAAAVVEDDSRVDDMHLAIEQRVIGMLATQQPMAIDLRTLASIMAMSIDLERLADHAEGIADAVRRINGNSLLKPIVDIPYMEQVVRGMLHDVLEAFAHRDPVLAQAVAAKDDTVDALRAQIFRVLLTYMAENPRKLSEALDLVIVAQHLERAADHVTNIAERVIYIVTGEMRSLNEDLRSVR
jgi:phosphate transport system protein